MVEPLIEWSPAAINDRVKTCPSDRSPAATGLTKSPDHLQQRRTTRMTNERKASSTARAAGVVEAEEHRPRRLHGSAEALSPPSWPSARPVRDRIPKRKRSTSHGPPWRLLRPPTLLPRRLPRRPRPPPPSSAASLAVLASCRTVPLRPHDRWGLGRDVRSGARRGCRHHSASHGRADHHRQRRRQPHRRRPSQRSRSPMWSMVTRSN